MRGGVNGGSTGVTEKTRHDERGRPGGGDTGVADRGVGGSGVADEFAAVSGVGGRSERGGEGGDGGRGVSAWAAALDMEAHAAAGQPHLTRQQIKQLKTKLKRQLAKTNRQGQGSKA